MEQAQVISFFDALAEDWDAHILRNEAVIGRILDNCGVGPGTEVLDVACGTGVLFPDYLARGTASVTAVDVSPNMVRLAAERARGTRIRVLLGDAQRAELGGPFDCVVIYNAFPHFPEPRALLERLAGLLKPGGRLTVAHGMSRAKLLQHHNGAASQVSLPLPELEETRSLLPPPWRVTTAISDETMYQVVWTAPEGQQSQQGAHCGT